MHNVSAPRTLPCRTGHSNSQPSSARGVIMAVSLARGARAKNTMVAAGTAIGAMVGGPQGALIGAGVGVVARPVLHAASAYNNQLGKIPLARTFAVTGLSALSAAAWMSR